MEINLQFDDEGRTRCGPLLLKTSLDYNPKSVMTTLDEMDESILDELLFDCEIADCALMPRTFWMPAPSVPAAAVGDLNHHNNNNNNNNNDNSSPLLSPKCALEQMALQVFQQHVPVPTSSSSSSTTTTATSTSPSTTNPMGYDPETSGAEWWVQIRPSPPRMGRYAVLMNDHDNDNEDSGDNNNNDNNIDMSKEGISFHWDKDEELRIMAGGNLYVHPHISTVTYLSNFGAPTMTCNVRVHALTGEWIVPTDDASETAEGYLSWPRLGKHLSFDGGFLHAAPSDLMKEGEFQTQCKVPGEDDDDDNDDNDQVDENKIKIMRRRHRRVTFLVNIWLNYKPVNVERFPELMLDKLSKPIEGLQLFRPSTSALPATHVVVVVDDNDKASTTTTTTSTVKSFTWPMGGTDSQETIIAPMPLNQIRENSSEGPNVHIQWTQSAPLLLVKGNHHSETTPAMQQNDVVNSTTESSSSQENNNKKNNNNKNSACDKRQRLH